MVSPKKGVQRSRRQAQSMIARHGFRSSKPFFHKMKNVELEPQTTRLLSISHKKSYKQMQKKRDQRIMTIDYA